MMTHNLLPIRMNANIQKPLLTRKRPSCFTTYVGKYPPRMTTYLIRWIVTNFGYEMFCVSPNFFKNVRLVIRNVIYLWAPRVISFNVRLMGINCRLLGRKMKMCYLCPVESEK